MWHQRCYNDFYMKKKLQFILVFFTFISTGAIFSQELIVWKPENKLTWDNFKGSPDKSMYKTANTYIACSFYFK